MFPDLYLPVMTEANLRVLQPWRCYLPVLPAWWAFASRISRLNTCAPMAVSCVYRGSPSPCIPLQVPRPSKAAVHILGPTRLFQAGIDDEVANALMLRNKPCASDCLAIVLFAAFGPNSLGHCRSHADSLT